MLNAYLEGWAVLNPNTGSEAFNVQEGLPFNLGPILAVSGQTVHHDVHTAGDGPDEVPRDCVET